MSLDFLRSELYDPTEFSLKFPCSPPQLWSQNITSIYFSPGNNCSAKPQSIRLKVPQILPALEFSIYRSKDFMPVSKFLNAFAPRMHNFHLKTFLGWLLWWSCLLAKKTTLLQKFQRGLQVLSDNDLMFQIMSNFSSGETPVLCTRGNGIGFQCVQTVR